MNLEKIIGTTIFIGAVFIGAYGCNQGYQIIKEDQIREKISQEAWKRKEHYLTKRNRDYEISDSWKKFSGLKTDNKISYTKNFEIIQEDGDYYIFDKENKTKEKVFNKNMVEGDFRISDNGNFVAAKTGRSWDDSLIVYVRDEKKYIEINNPLRDDSPLKIYNNGNLIALSGDYCYNQRKYNMNGDNIPLQLKIEERGWKLK